MKNDCQSDHPVPVTVDLDEGRFANFACIKCRTEVSRLGIARPARLYIASLDCVDCGEQLAEFDQFLGITRAWIERRPR